MSHWLKGNHLHWKTVVDAGEKLVAWAVKAKCLPTYRCLAVSAAPTYRGMDRGVAASAAPVYRSLSAGPAVARPPVHRSLLPAVPRCASSPSPALGAKMRLVLVACLGPAAPGTAKELAAVSTAYDEARLDFEVKAMEAATLQADSSSHARTVTHKYSPVSRTHVKTFLLAERLFLLAHTPALRPHPHVQARALQCAERQARRRLPAPLRRHRARPLGGDQTHPRRDVEPARPPTPRGVRRRTLARARAEAAQLWGGVGGVLGRGPHRRGLGRLRAWLSQEAQRRQLW